MRGRIFRQVFRPGTLPSVDVPSRESPTRVRPSKTPPSLPGLFLVLGIAGCVSPIEDSVGLPPLFELSRPSDDVGNPPKSAPRRGTLRPLAMVDRGDAHWEFSLLWPLFRMRHDPAAERDWLLPLYYRNARRTADGGLDQDTVVFPLFYFGNDPKEGGYLLFFPIGGTLKGLLGQDRTDWALFPLYLRAVREARRSHHLLWPIFNWVRGPHHGGGRFFPLFGRYTASTRDGDEKYDRRFLLWPLFHHQRNNLDSGRPVTSYWFFPFFGKIESENLVRYSFLWPLFTLVRRGEETTMALPVVPFIVARGPNREQTDLWPLFGVKKHRDPSGASYRQYFLWPIQRYQYSNVGDQIQESFWFLPFFWHHRRHDLLTDRERATTRVWPLFSVRRREDGSRRVDVVDLFPFEDEERFGRLYSRLWRFYRYRDLGDDRGSDWEFLWGLVQGKRRTEGRSFSLLGGLFAREAAVGDTRWRILYIPF